jgi:hypothetical protein
VQSGYKEITAEKSELSFETPACRNMSLGAEELPAAEQWEGRSYTVKTEASSDI